MEGLGGKKWRTAIPTPSSGTSIRLVISWRRPWTHLLSVPTQAGSPTTSRRESCGSSRSLPSRYRWQVLVPSLSLSFSAVFGGADNSAQRRRAERNQSANEKLGGVATRPRGLQGETLMGRCAVTSSAELAPDAPADSDASMIDTAKTSFRTLHDRRQPCSSL